MEAMKILFFILIFLSAYSYVIYPLILVFLSFFLRKDIKTSDEAPYVTMIISAYNEEAVIGDKIKNSLLLDYPKDRIDILVVSDCSTDKTDDIVKSYSKDNIELLSHPIRLGKSAGLNEAVKKAKGDVLIFSDADAMYPSDTIRKFVEYLSDATVGLVTGSTKYIAEKDENIAETSGIYTKLERFIKRHESSIGSCVGADGAIFSMKKKLYVPLKSYDINDFVIPLHVVKHNFRAVLHDGLFCLEASSADFTEEFSRQIRITNRTIRALFGHSGLMNFLRYPLFSFELISHKLIRFSVPYFLLLLLPINILLINEGLLYKFILAGQVVSYLAVFIGYLLERAGKDSRIFGMAYYFVMVNISILFGWMKFISGEKQVTWDVQKK